MTSSNGSKSGCFSGVLRRFLCKGSLPTHPSDLITESNTTDSEFPKKDQQNEFKLLEEVPPAPGVVARLMGLHSLPDASWVPKSRVPDSVSRSKSVNFVDYLLKFDLTQAQHRRVRTSSSFREVPSLLNQPNDFLVVCFNNGGDHDQCREIGSNLKKSEDSGFAEAKQGNEQRSKKKENVKQRGMQMKKKENQRHEGKISKLKNEPRREIGRQSSNVRKSSVLASYKKNGSRNGVLNSKSNIQMRKSRSKNEASGGTKLTTNRKNHCADKKKTEPEFDSEYSSPISVLNADDFSKGVVRQKEMNSKRATAMKFSYSEDAEQRREMRSKDYNAESDYYNELVEGLCRLTDKDITESNWMIRNNNLVNYEDLEEICVEFEHQILNVLLVQLLNELV